MTPPRPDLTLRSLEQSLLELVKGMGTKLFTISHNGETNRVVGEYVCLPEGAKILKIESVDKDEWTDKTAPAIRVEIPIS